MKALRNILNMILNVLAGGSFLIMTALTCWQVFTRYVLGNPSTWSEELVGFLFAWMSLFGACLVTGERGHMNIPLLVDSAAPGLKKILLCLGEVIAFLFSMVMLLSDLIYTYIDPRIKARYVAKKKKTGGEENGKKAEA